MYMSMRFLAASLSCLLATAIMGCAANSSVKTVQTETLQAMPETREVPVITPAIDVEEHRTEADTQQERLTLSVILEGMPEEVEALEYSSQLGFKMLYIPGIVEEISKFEDGVSFICERRDDVPVVFLAITAIEGKSLDEVTEGLALQNGMEEGYEEITVGIYPARLLYLTEGDGVGSRIAEFYAIEHGEKVFLAELDYYMEVEEGLAARLRAMLNSVEFTA